jgi:hypothetical protein
MTHCKELEVYLELSNLNFLSAEIGKRDISNAEITSGHFRRKGINKLNLKQIMKIRWESFQLHCCWRQLQQVHFNGFGALNLKPQQFQGLYSFFLFRRSQNPNSVGCWPFIRILFFSRIGAS